MDLYKSSEIAKKFNVSSVTIMNWIDASIEGRNSLQTSTVGKKYKVIKNDHNDAELTRLSVKAQGFKNNNYSKIIEPDKEIYKLFTEDQLLEILIDMERHYTLQHKYTYIIAKYWNEFYMNNHAIASDSNNHLLELNLPIFKYFLNDIKEVTVIDLGCGNGLPSVQVLRQLSDYFNIKNYTSVDISEQMNLLTKDNMKIAFPSIPSNYFTMDFERDSLNSVILKNTTSIITLSGGTLPNLEHPDISIKNVSRSMKETDMFVVNFSLNNKISRSMLQYANNALSNAHHFWFFEMIGIDVKNCTMELTFTTKSCRQKSIILDKDYIINFNISGYIKSIHLKKDQKIACWRHYLFTENEFVDMLEDAGLRMHNLTVDKNGWSALAVCKVKESPLTTKLGV
jgi:SAM-dependent methyltransferase